MASTIYVDSLSLDKGLGKGLENISWVVTERNLWFFGSKGHRICSQPLNIPKSFLIVDQILLYWQETEAPLC